MINQTPLHRLILMVTAIMAAFVADHAYSDVYVKGYYRKNGKYVAPHYRSDPDGRFGNNWSTKGNINPHTGEYGTRVTPPGGGGASYTGSWHLGSSTLRRQNTEYASSGLIVNPHNVDETSLPLTSPDPLSDKRREVATMNYHGIGFSTTHQEFLHMFPNAKTAWPVDSVGLHSYAIDDLDGEADAVWFQFLDNQLYCLGFTYSEDRVRDYGGKAVLLDRATQRFGPPTGEQAATTRWLFPSIDRTVAAGLDGSRWCMLISRTSLQERIDRKKIQLDAKEDVQRNVEVGRGEEGDEQGVEISEDHARIFQGAKLVQAADKRTELPPATAQGETRPDSKPSSPAPSVLEDPTLAAERKIETGLATVESPSPVATPLADRNAETQEQTRHASKPPRPKEGWIYWRPTATERAEMEAEAEATAGWNRKPQPTELQITPPGLLVSREQYGDEWPFTVPEGFVESIDYAIVFHTRDGKTYALNGIARGQEHLSYLDTEPIRLPHPLYGKYGQRVGLGPLIDAGIRTRTSTAKTSTLKPHRNTSGQRTIRGDTTGPWTVPQTKIVCDEFNLVTQVTGSTLDLSIDTDLPDDTVVMVSVSRSYWEKGESTEYSEDYFSEKSTIGKWKSNHRVSLANDIWISALRAKQIEMSRLGLGFDVASISDKITARMVVPIFQTNSHFGKQNANLSGKAVRTKGLRVVRDEIEIVYPMMSPPIGKSPFPNLDPQNLDVGQIYVVSKKTPLVPALNPSDPLAAIVQMKQIPQGGAFKVYEIRKKGGTPWYRVEAVDQRKKKIGSGWINSVVLLGQKLKPFR